MILFSISSLFFLNINRNLTDDSNVTTHTLVVEYVVKLFIVIVLEKAAIPLGPSVPNKPLIFIFSIFMGLFFGFLINVYKVLIENL